MNTKKRGLSGGRGLSALLGQAKEAVAEVAAVEDGKIVDGELRKIAIHSLQRGMYQPRRDLDADALAELAASIKQHGVMQPIVIRKRNDESFEIVAGERRWRAAQIAELEFIPAIIRDISDETAAIMALIENIQREDLNPLEQAMALQKMAEEFKLTHEKLADTVGKSRASVTNLLRMLQLEPEVRLLLERGDLDMGHAKALLGLSEQDQVDAAKIVVGKALSVRQTEELVRKIQQSPKLPPKTNHKKEDPDITRLMDQLSERLGAAVKINHEDSGRGRVVISYHSLEELDGILSHFH